MDKWWLILGAVNGFLAVALGAFGAHGLHDRLAASDRLATWETAVSYQVYHGLALLAVGLLAARGVGFAGPASGWCFLLGIVLFSGSLYALCLTQIKMLGAITPIGGMLFLAGWVLLAVAGAKVT